MLYLIYVAFRKSHREEILVLLSLGASFVGLLLLAFFWNYQVVIGAVDRSLPLLLLTVFVGSSNCLSSPIFLPIVSQYPQGFTTAFATGEASTGMVAALVALIQSSVGSEAFSTTAFFLVMAGIQACSAGAYVCLRFLPDAKALRLRHQVSAASLPEKSSQSDSDAESMHINSELLPQVPSSALLQSRWEVMKNMMGIIWRDLLVTFWLNWMETGALNSILVYSLSGYGHSYYLAALWGGMTAAPLGTLMTGLFAWGQPWHWSLLWASFGVLIIFNSFLPLAVTSGVFGGFMVAFVLVTRWALGYTKALVYLHVQRQDPLHNGGMFLVALFQQVGAAVGSLVFFFLVVYGPWFN